MLRLKYSILCTIYFLIASAALIAQMDLKDNVNKIQIDSLFESWDDLNKPGIAVGIVSNGKIVHLEGYGSANLEHNIPIEPDTKFLYAGMSEQFVAYGILLLEEQGKLSLQDEINKYLDSEMEIGNHIKIIHLLSHTSGVNDIAVIKKIAGWNMNDELTNIHVSKLLKAQQKFENKAGEKYNYTRIESKLLESILEKVTGKNVSEFMQEQVFAPLKMDNSLFASSPNQLIPNKATGYYLEEDKYFSSNTIKDDSEVSLFYSTVEDMCKWAIHLSNGNKTNNSLLAKFESLVKESGESVSKENSAKYLGQHQYWNFKGTNKLYLIGMKAGHACKLVRFPDQDLSIVVMGNAGEYNGHWSSFVADLYLDKYYSESTHEHNNNESAEKIKLTNRELKRFCGKYWNSERFFTTTITLENDTLRYHEDEFQFSMNLIPVGENKFLGSSTEVVEFVFVNGLPRLSLTVSSGDPILSNFYNENDGWLKDVSKFIGVYYNEQLDCRYEIAQDEDGIKLINSKLGTFELKPLGNNKFKTMDNTLKMLEFENLHTNPKFSFSNRVLLNIVFHKVQ